MNDSCCELQKSKKDVPDSCCDDEHGGNHFLPVIISGIFTGILLLVQWQNLLPQIGIIAIASIAIISGAWFIFPKAIKAITHLSLDMNVLMSVAVIGAACINEWQETATVVFLFSLSELLESLSVARARRAIQSLLELSPDLDFIKEGNDLKEVAVE